MTMKRTELEKRKGLAINNALRQGGNRFGPAQAAAPDRKAQREAERAAGLVPFAVKLPAPLVRALTDRAQHEAIGINELVAALLQGTAAPITGTESAATADAASAAPPPSGVAGPQAGRR
jgi:hypothetical protein